MFAKEAVKAGSASPTHEDSDSCRLRDRSTRDGESKAGAYDPDADDAMKAFVGLSGESLVIDEATNRRLLRQIDLHLLPVMCLVYGLQFVDKVTLSYASVMHMNQDLHLTDSNYSWLGSLFYVGYIAWEWPTTRLLQRLPIAKYSAFNTIIWGAVLACFAAVNNFPGAATIRLLLGIFEASVTPGFALITSQWWTKREQASRAAIWYCFAGVAQVVGGPVAYGIARGGAEHGYAINSWRVLYLVFGILTLVSGILLWFVVPDNQLNAYFLSKHDRVLAVERLRVNSQGIGNRRFKWHQFREALTDPLVWLITLFSLVMDTPNGAVTVWFSQLIVNFGFSPQEALLYATPAGGLWVIYVLTWGFLGAKLQQRLLVGMVSMASVTMGIVLIVALPESNRMGRLVGYWFSQSGSAAFLSVLTQVTTNIAGATKKSTAAALFLIAYCAGNLIGPQIFLAGYTTGPIIILALNVAALLIMVSLYLYLRWANIRKARARAAPGYVKKENQEFLDLTDRENPEFVYAL